MDFTDSQLLSRLVGTLHRPLSVAQEAVCCGPISEGVTVQVGISETFVWIIVK